MKSPAARLEHLLLSSSYRTGEALRGARLIQETEKELELEKELEQERLEVERLQEIERLEQERVEKERIALEKEKEERELEIQMAKALLSDCEPVVDVEANALLTETRDEGDESSLEKLPSTEVEEETEASDGPINSALDSSLLYSDQKQQHEVALQQLREAANRHDLAAKNLEDISRQVSAIFFSTSLTLPSSGSRAETFARLGDLLLSLAEEELEFEYTSKSFFGSVVNKEGNGKDDDDNEGRGSPGPHQRNDERRGGGEEEGRRRALRKRDVEEKNARSTPSSVKRENRQTTVRSAVKSPAPSRVYTPPLSSINVAAAHSALLSTDRSARTLKQSKLVKSRLETLKPIRIIVGPTSQ